MNDPQEALKELRVDWENVLSDDFNPLHLSLQIISSSTLASDFRDMYHQLEYLMEQIIAANYKGFSDSVLSYNEFNRCNKEALGHLEGMAKRIEEIQTAEFELDGISAEKELSAFYGTKYGVCRGISEVKQIMEDLDEDPRRRSQALVNALDLIDNRDYIRIGAVDGYRKTVYRRYMDAVEEVCDKVLEYIFFNRYENLHFFKCIVILGSLYELEAAIAKNFSAYTFQAIEGIIVSSYRASSNDLEQVCKKVACRFGMIKSNMESIIESTFRHFEVDRATGAFKVRNNQQQLPNFSSTGDKSFKYCIDEGFVLSAVEEEMGRFIARYCSRDAAAEIAFDAESIVDEVNYGKIYGSKHPISSRLCRTSRMVGTKNNQYTVISAPSSEALFYLLKYTKDPSLHSFVKKKTAEFYSGPSLERDERKIDLILGSSPLRVDSRTRRLAIYSDLACMIRKDYAESQVPLRGYLADRLGAFLRRAYQEIFTSEIVLSCVRLDGPKATAAFRESLITKHINKKDLFLSKEKYQQVVAILNTLKAFDELLSEESIVSLHQLYHSSFRMQLNVEFFYFFDLLYRQGNCHFYTEKIIRMVRLVYDEARTNAYFEGIYENIEYYSVHNAASLNVHSGEELEKFVEHIRILDEVMGEIEFFSTLSGLYRFFDEVLAGKSENKYGKMLQRKIRQTGQ